MASGASRKPFIAAFIGNTIIAASKFTAAAVTGSSAMIAEGIHSIVDATNSLLMLLGIRLSTRKPDPEHPFGHGKELYFWALIVAMVIFGIGGGISIYEGIDHFLHPTPITQPMWNYVVLLIAFILDGWTLVIAYQEFKPHQGRKGLWHGIKASKDPTKFTVLLEDGAATFGIAVAAAGLWLTGITGDGRYDAAASIIIGLLLCTVATILAVESKNLLVGESASPETLRGIRETVEADEAVTRLHRLLTMHLGPQELLLNIDLEFVQNLDSRQTAATVDRLETRIRDCYPEVRQIFLRARVLNA